VRTLAAEDPELVVRFEARYANARAVAERWRNRLHSGDKPEPGRLADYLALIGYSVPDEAAPGAVGETIRALRGRLERGLPLTAAQRERWDHLIEHNRHDCAGMRRVCLRATGNLDAAAGPALGGAVRVAAAEHACWPHSQAKSLAAVIVDGSSEPTRLTPGPTHE
jgi:hypothetical protein